MNNKLQKILAWPFCLIFLIGMTLVGASKVICITDNGHILFETICLPCCGEGENSCEATFPGEQHNDLADCSPCLNVELDSPLWSSRIENTDFVWLGHISLELSVNAYSSLVSTENGGSRNIKFYLAYGQSPSTYSITATILRC